MSGGSGPVSALANYVLFVAFLVLGGGSVVFFAFPKAKGRLFELEHFSFL